VIRRSRQAPRIAALLFAAVAAACASVGPDHQAPAPKLPSTFQEGGAVLRNEPADLAGWWRRLGDPLLDRLVERALQHNLDLAAAVARIAEARALRGSTETGWWPRVDTNGTFQRREESRNTPFGQFQIDADRYTVGLDATWELDLWGSVRRAVEAADADLLARVEALHGVQVSVAAEVATDYVQLRVLQERLAIARDNLRLQERTMALVQARAEAGLVGARDVAQATSNLASTRSRLPALEAELRRAENRLAVLLGLPPGALAAELALPGSVPSAPASIAVGVPADVVRQRPDVREAERELAAATARIGVATANLYPRLVMLGTFGFDSIKGSNLFDTDSNLFYLGPSLRWNLFDAGRTRREIAAQDARAKAAMVRFEHVMLRALEESENAMTAFAREHTRREHLQAAAVAAAQAQEFASAEYGEGLTDFQNVLDSERAVADLQDQLAASRAAITTNLIAVYKALGGGWESLAAPAPTGVPAGE
jgi:NodT family efflux transporter outer membrane factor (OMF) lipoprotein